MKLYGGILFLYGEYKEDGDFYGVISLVSYDTFTFLSDLNIPEGFSDRYAVSTIDFYDNVSEIYIFGCIETVP